MMDTIEYINPERDRSTWGPGLWDGEPDKMQFPDPATGLPCLMKRNMSGAWCGYVGVAEGHPWFDVHYDEVPVDVHGSLTYSDFCEPGDSELAICHIPSPGEPDNVWWLGFDCNHYMDIAPAYRVDFGDGTYRDVAYVKAEIASLAAQIAGATT